MESKTENETPQTTLSTTSQTTTTLPLGFIQFCEKNGISPDMYHCASSIPRFIRLKSPMFNELVEQLLAVESPTTENKTDVAADDNESDVLQLTSASNEEPPKKKQKTLQEEVNALLNIEPVSWLPKSFHFYQLPNHLKIAHLPLYKQGHLYGLDISSAMAVFALDPSPKDNVLDMCCAPGAKLCFLSDYISLKEKLLVSADDPESNQTEENSSFYVTGADVSIDRLNTCKNLLKKYKTRHTRLVLVDGTQFSLTPQIPSPERMPGRKLKRCLTKWLQEQQGHLERHEKEGKCESLTLPSSIGSNGLIFYETGGSWQDLRIQEEKSKAKTRNNNHSTTSSSPSNESEAPVVVANDNIQPAMNQIPATQPADTESNNNSTNRRLFDKIIVDAECTTDGSVKHIIKMVEEGWDKYHSKYFNEERMSEITTLQRSLLCNSYRLLRPGGTLVYSTCSFTIEQNEQVIQWFLNETSEGKSAQLVHPFQDTLVDMNLVKCRMGSVKNTVRFDPVSTNTSGLFIAKLIKSE